LTDYINYEVPQMVKKYDIDLVLGLAGWSGFPAWFLKPITSEGIPDKGDNPEYLLESYIHRMPSGAPQRFYKRLVKKGLIKKGDHVPLADPPEPGLKTMLENMNDETRNDLLEMDGMIFKRFLEKLQKLKTSSGSTPKFFIFNVPWEDWQPLNDFNESYWRELCVRNHINFLDLYSAYNVLKPSFYPTEDSFKDFHYNIYGSQLIAYLLSYYLPEQKLIPFETTTSTK
jgi:hypothetical protein